ncbi:MAG: hypothetical protein NVS4B3_05120 [Gemmatimonadaceae bacterium]
MKGQSLLARLPNATRACMINTKGFSAPEAVPKSWLTPYLKAIRPIESSDEEQALVDTRVLTPFATIAAPMK